MAWISRGLLLLIAFTAVSADTRAVLTETFAQGRLDPGRWALTAEGDFRQWTVDVVEVLEGTGDFHLSLSADTRGTRDDTITVLGVRSLPLLRLGPEVRISLDLDWNNQVNGSYLAAAIVLSPQATIKSPFKCPDWLKVEYVGVPPGQKARMVIGLKRRGQERTLYNEGWPDSNRVGRTIGLQRLMIVLRDHVLQVWENDKLLYDSQAKVSAFNAAYLYLQMTTHSNYPRRTIYFDNIHVEQGRVP